MKALTSPGKIRPSTRQRPRTTRVGRFTAAINPPDKRRRTLVQRSAPRTIHATIEANGIRHCFLYSLISGNWIGMHDVSFASSGPDARKPGSET